MTEVDETLAEVVESSFLKCNSCTNEYQSPCLLPCLHSFCEECIAKIPKEICASEQNDQTAQIQNGRVQEYFSCPICMSQISIPEEGVGSFQRNSFISDLCKLYDYKHNTKRTCDYCSFAGKTVNAVSLCLDCHDDMCLECEEAHHKTKLTRNHKVIPFKQIKKGLYDHDIREFQRQKCEQHEDSFTTAFCLDREKLVCSQCQSTNHNLVDFKTALPKYSKQIKGLVTSIKNRLPSIQNYCELLEKYSQSLEDTQAQLLTQTEEQAQILHTMIDACKNKMQAEITEACANEIETAKYKLKNLQIASNSLHNNLEFLNQLMKHGKPDEILMMHREITIRLTQLIKMQLDGLSSKLRIGFVCGSNTEQNIQTIFGKLSSDKVPVGKKESSLMNGSGLSVSSILPNVKNSAELIVSFDTDGKEEDRDIWPTGVAVTKQDNIVIVDRDNKKIKIFDSVGKLVIEFWGENGHKIGIPFDATVLDDDNIAVTDYEKENVKIFTQSGKHVHTISGFFKHPRGITTNSKGEIIVVDCRHLRITIHDPKTGNLLKTIEGKNESGKKILVDPFYITTTHDDNIMVTDTAAPNIKVFSPTGKYIADYGNYGIKEEQILQPFGICTDEYGYIFVADNQNHRIHLLMPDGKLCKFLLTKSDSIWHPMAVNISRKGFFIVSEALGKIRLYKYL